MTVTIEVDDEVWSALKRCAEPFVDTPNTVLRRLLELDGQFVDVADAGSDQRAGAGADTPQLQQKANRAPVGSLLPETQYELPILRALADAGGSAPTRDVIAAVGKMVADQLTALDREALPNGGERWESRVQFSRLRMKEKGLLKSGSPRGLWELAEAGTAALEEARA